MCPWSKCEEAYVFFCGDSRYPVLWKNHFNTSSEASETSGMGRNVSVAPDSGFGWVRSCDPLLVMLGALALALTWFDHPSGRCSAGNLLLPPHSTSQGLALSETDLVQ